MSLFRSKEWWSVNLNEKELYDCQSLLVAVIGKDRYQSILLGNHEGLFRAYEPSSGLGDDGEIVGYRPSDLLLEMQLTAPILHMATGTLVSGCHEQNLAILHPKMVSVYALTRKGSGDKSAGEAMSMESVYQLQMRHSAHSLVAGPFGGSRGRDFICVQALDGLLSFYEQESFAFQIRLPDFLLPSTFAYLDRIDCFLFLNSNWIFDCYSYESLACASRTDGDAARKIVKYWSYNLGEGILDVRTVASDRYNIVVLTERNLYNVSDGGQVIFAKRLEYKPMAFHAFATSELKKLIVLVAGDDRLVNIYENASLRWSVRIDEVPVSVSRITLSNLYGGIVLLSENGRVQCIYLGTRPSVYLMPALPRPEVNVRDAEAELRRLHAEISEKDVADPAEEMDVVAVRLVVDAEPRDANGERTCGICLEISNQAPVNRIQVTFAVDPPLATADKTRTVSCCDKTTVESRAFVAGPGPAANLDVAAYVSYVNANGAPFVVERRGRLPLSLVLAKAAPTKEAKYKITVVTNKPVCPLNALFAEFVDAEANPNAVAFKAADSDAVVTVLTAKTTQRYRLQSDAPERIPLVLNALVDRLRKHFRASPDFTIGYDGALPLHAFFESVESYHELLRRRRAARERLSQRTCQYRTIQKKVLVNLKDVTPKPISNLSNILKDTYNMIMSSAAEMDAVEAELETSRLSINALGALVVALMELMTIAAGDLAYLRVVFSGNVYDTEDQGWLEVQLAAASFLLRTALAKSARDQQRPVDIALDPVTSVAKLAKTFSAVVDRATKGTHLLERSEFESDKEVMSTVPGAESARTADVGTRLPEGSRLADLALTFPPVDAAAAAPVPVVRRDKRLAKQERVDSLGIVRDVDDSDKPERKSSYDDDHDDACDADSCSGRPAASSINFHPNAKNF